MLESEINMLRSKGHSVEVYTRSNSEISLLSKLQLGLDILWSQLSYKELFSLIDTFKPDVIHVHNFFPLISPSIYWLAYRKGIPIIQTLHNFRLMCLGALYLRNGAICEKCIGKLPWRGVFYSCYRGSNVQSLGLFLMILLHRLIGTFNKKVTCYIALNTFCRNKFIQGGLSAEKISIKPNFVECAHTKSIERKDVLFVGRLSLEKGVKCLAQAMCILPNIRLKVIGSGDCDSVFEGLDNIELLGKLDADSVFFHMSSSKYLVVPSIWYENFPRTIVEAFAAGLPVIVSNIGALAEIVDHEITGLHFEIGNSSDLADKIIWADEHPTQMAEMGKNARAEFLRKYSLDKNYIQLMDIYNRAIINC